MPLTKDERDFLGAYVHEATHEPFGGPATDALRQRGIYYNDIHGVLTMYHRQLRSEGILPLGKHNPNPPPSPWADREEANLRSKTVMEECKANERKTGVAPAVEEPRPVST